MGVNLTLLNQLFATGKKSFQEHLDFRYSRLLMPIGVKDITVIRRVDFIEHADMCLEFVLLYHPIYVLNDDGALMLTISRNTMPVAPGV